MDPGFQRWVVVTGAAQGIGYATVLMLLQSGFCVLAVDLDGDALERALLHLSRQIDPERLEMVTADVADETCGRLVAERLGVRSCHGLVNNAACMQRGKLDDVSCDSFSKVMSTNALGALLMIKALRNKLREAQGRVVNIGSTNAYGGEAALLEYSMSKAALTCATRNLAPQLALEGIRICQVNVGWTLTERELERKNDEGWDADWHQNLDPARAPFGRLLWPEEVAGFISFLFTNSCQLLNGSIIDFAQNAVGMAAQP